MRVLFITRKHPPVVGGMENLSYDLISGFPSEKTVIALKRSQRHLAWFFPYAAVRGTGLLKTGMFDVIHIGDALLAPLGAFLKRVSGVPVVVTVHGLDITWKAPPYQWVIPKLVATLDRVICISNYTRDECVKRGIDPSKCVMIPCGIDTRLFEEVPSKDSAKTQLSVTLGRDLTGCKILTTVGRLVLRKGHTWFLQNVYQRLPENAIYLIAGEGPERENIEHAISEQGLRDRVVLLGQVDEGLRNNLLAAADVFVMPNIRVEGDVEGFGIVALEAAASGAVVVASNIDGIPAAVNHGQNGFLIEVGDAEAMGNSICLLLRDLDVARRFQERAREFTLSRFDWDAVRQSYAKEFEKLARSND